MDVNSIESIESIDRTIWDRVGVAAVGLLIVAFAFLAMSPLIAAAGAEDSVAARNDGDSNELVAVADDEDDELDDLSIVSDGTTDDAVTDDDDASDDGTDTGDSGAPSIGSFSANTATGTTRGTGISQSVSDSGDASANTATGTTRGTGGSNSVSASS